MGLCLLAGAFCAPALPALAEAWAEEPVEEPEGIPCTVEGTVLTVAEGVQRMEAGFWGADASQVEVVVLPQSLTYVGPYGIPYGDTVKEYRVAPGNLHFQAVDGVLYTKDGAGLVAFPAARGGSYALLPETRWINNGAFVGNSDLWELTLPEGMEQVTPPAGVQQTVPPDGEEPVLVIDEGERFSEPPYGLRRLELPSTLRTLADSWMRVGTLQDFQVAENSPYLYDLEGVLFSREGALLSYPRGRQPTHYDVPSGTTAIGDGAFSSLWQLESVALPSSVQSIGELAFSGCTALQRVATPLGLQFIGEFAFNDCVSLESLALPPGVQLAERAFDNCPRLTGEAGVFGKLQTEFFPNGLRAIVNPEDTHGTVPLLETASASANALALLPCGLLVNLEGQEGKYYRVFTYLLNQDGGTEGYVEKSRVQLINHLQTLFTPDYAGMAPGQSTITLLGTECIWPDSQSVQEVLTEPKGIYFLAGQAALVWAGAEYSGYQCMPIRETQLYVKDIPEGKRFGYVVSSGLQSRLHLREKPTKSGKSLGKFFSGTQVEILGEEGDFFEVRVGFQEGYMMKEFVREVKEWTGE